MTEACIPGEPQFGLPPAQDVRDRPTAFGVCLRDGKIAIAHITRSDGVYFDLPGGAIEAGEDPPAALVREMGEEVGLSVVPGALLARAAQFMTTEAGETVNNRSWLFEAHALRDDAALKIEDDHTLVWLDPSEALLCLRLENHVWAVVAWMRRSAKA